MKLKLKIYLSLLLLFALIVLLSGVGSYFLQQLAEDSKAIMKDNFQSLQYMQNLNSGLDKVISILSETPEEPGQEQALKRELENCRKLITWQMANITEPGEKLLSFELQSEFEVLSKLALRLGKPESSGQAFYFSHFVPQLTRVRTLISNIFSLNEEALLSKNARASKTAENVVVYMGLFGVFGILFALAYVLKIPGYILKPLSKLNEGIKQIAVKNYKHQLDITGTDELGDIAGSFNQMAARLYYYSQSDYALLLAEKKRIDAIINQMHEGIIGIDESNTILFANMLACELLNTEEENIKGKPIHSLALSNDLLQSIETDLASGDLETKSILIVQKAQEKRFSREIIPVFSQQPDEMAPVGNGFVVVLTDITVFSEKDFAKTQFIATISHELKTPLASIIMSLKLLKDGRAGKLGKDQEELLDSIKDDSERLLKIIGELLKMTQVETGNIQLDNRPIKPVHVIETSVHALNQQAIAKGLRLVQEVQTEKQVMGDGDKITWVIINFLSNAIRYAPVNTDIILSVSEYPDKMIRFSVRDFGPGIDPEFQEKLFEKYFKVPGSNQSGTGLGLAISKEFIKAMGGTIGVESVPGKGSTFYFLLPELEDINS